MNPHDLHVNKKMWWYRRLVGVLEQGRIQDFKLGGALKKLRRAEEGAKFVEVFRVKKYDFTPILGGGGRVLPPWIRPCGELFFHLHVQMKYSSSL